MKRVNPAVLWWAVILLVGVVCSAGPGAQLPADKVPAFDVPRMSKPPVLDGKIDPAEWREAVAVSGIAQQNPGGNLLIMRPTTYWLAWDDEHVYLACRTWLMPGYKPRVTGRSPHAANTFEDAMELACKPMGKNVAAGRTNDFFKFTVNCLGFDGDLGRIAVGQIFRNWQPDFRTAVRQTPQGTAPLGGSWWECELVMSVKDFDLTGPNRAGDVWKFMLGFNHIPGWMQATIPINSGYFDASGHCTGTLVDKAPSVQMTMEELPGLKDGVAAVKFLAYNPTAEPVKFDILAEFTEQIEQTDPKTRQKTVEEKPLFSRQEALTVEPGKTGEFALSEKLPRDIGQNTGTAFYRVTAGGKEVLRYFVFFQTGYMDTEEKVWQKGYPDKWVKYAPPAAAFPLAVTFNPARDNINVSADSYYLDDPNSAAKATYKVIGEDGKTVQEGVIEQPRTFYFQRMMDLAGLKPGKYTVESSLVTRDGKTLGPVTQTFRKLDEPKVFQAWWNTTLGDPDRVLPPFEAMKRSGSAVSMWGRTYKLNELGMPAEVVSQDKAVSAGPSRIVATIGGQEQVIELKGQPTFTEQKDWRVSFQGKAAGAGLAFRAGGHVEQDGLAYVELTYAPQDGRPLTIDALRLEFPLNGQYAQCLLCTGTGGNYCSRTNILLPVDKQGRLWSTLDTGKPGSKMTVGSFYPQVWVGNDQCGFVWWGDKDQGWAPADDVPAHEVHRAAGAVVLRNNIIGKPVTLDGPRTMVFSYMASPFRPLPKGWRAGIHSEDGTFSGPHKQRKDPKTGKEIDGWNWLSPPSYDPNEWAGLWAEQKRSADEHVRKFQPFSPSRARCGNYVHTSLPLSGYGANTSDRSVASYLATDWDRGALTDSQRRYMLYLADRAFREGGLRTIYWDIFYVNAFNSVQNGMAYVLPDGRVQPGYWGFNLRRYMMQMYALMSDRGLTPGSQVCHMTNCLPLVACGWMDGMMDGEWGEMRDETPGDWVDQYAQDRMRTFAVPQNFGVQVSWMNLIHIKDKQRVARIQRGFYDYIRLHDSWTGQNNYVIPNDILDFGLNDERIEYVPYWRDPFVQADKDTLVSLWRLGDRAILEVFNYDGGKARDVKVALDLGKLGLAPRAGTTLAAVDLAKPADEPACTLDGQTLAVPAVAPHTGRFIGLRLTDDKAVAKLQEALTGLGKLADPQDPAAADCPPAVLDFGMADAKAKSFPPGKPPHVTCEDMDVAVSMVRLLPDRLLLMVSRAAADRSPKDVTLSIDLDKLNLVPKLPWQEFVGVRTFAPAKAPAATLDFHGRKLVLPKMTGFSPRLVAVRMY